MEAAASTPTFLNYQTRKFLGGSISSISSTSTSSEFPDEEVEFEDRLFMCCDEADRAGLRELFEGASNRTLEVLLQIMITRTWNDHGGRRYFFDADAVKDAEALLGCSTANLNVLQICVLQGEEDMALDLLEHFYGATEKLGGRKALVPDFLAHQFGHGNTALHLAAFMGMADLCRRLLELGASASAPNSRNIKPVDCTNEEEVRQQFLKFKNHHQGLQQSSPAKAAGIESPVSSSRAANEASTGPASSPTTVGPTTTSVVCEPSPVAPAGSVATDSVDGHLERGEMVAPARSASLPAASAALRPESPGAAASYIPPVSKQRRRSGNTVKFAPEVLLMDFCQNGDPEGGAALSTIRAILFDAKHDMRMDVNQVTSPYRGFTPLQCACTHNQLEVAKLLITECNAMVNIRDFEGWTPLHSAAAEGFEDMVRLLCSVQRKQGESTTPGELWAVDAPIDLRPKNLDGETPEDLALEIHPDEDGTDHGKRIRDIISDYVRTYGHTPAPEILPRDENAYCQGADSDDGSADERVDGDGDESGSEKQGRKDHVEYVFYEEKEATETGDLVDMELRTGSTTVVREAQAAKEAEQLHSESDAFPSRVPDDGADSKTAHSTPFSASPELQDAQLLHSRTSEEQEADSIGAHDGKPIFETTGSSASTLESAATSQPVLSAPNVKPSASNRNVLLRNGPVTQSPAKLSIPIPAPKSVRGSAPSPTVAAPSGSKIPTRFGGPAKATLSPGGQKSPASHGGRVSPNTQASTATPGSPRKDDAVPRYAAPTHASLNKAQGAAGRSIGTHSPASAGGSLTRHHSEAKAPAPFQSSRRLDSREPMLPSGGSLVQSRSSSASSSEQSLPTVAAKRYGRGDASHSTDARRTVAPSPSGRLSRGQSNASVTSNGSTDSAGNPDEPIVKRMMKKWEKKSSSSPRNQPGSSQPAKGPQTSRAPRP